MPDHSNHGIAGVAGYHQTAIYRRLDRSRSGRLGRQLSAAPLSLRVITHFVFRFTAFFAPVDEPWSGSWDKGLMGDQRENDRWRQPSGHRPRVFREGYAAEPVTKPTHLTGKRDNRSGSSSAAASLLGQRRHGHAAAAL